MDLTLLNPIHRLLLADAPGWRSDLGDQLNAPPVQQILAERKDDANANSQYAAIIAPLHRHITHPIRTPDPERPRHLRPWQSP